MAKESEAKKSERNYKIRRENDGLFASGMIFLIGSGIVSLFNYLYHLFMGRMLGPRDYGILGSLFAIIYITTFLTNAFNRVVSKYSAGFNGKRQKGFLSYLIKKGLNKTILFGGAAFIIYMLLTPLIARFMNLESISGLIIVGFIAYFSLVSAVLIGALNGMQKFAWQNFSGVVSAFLKFSLAVFFVYVGLSVNGALSAILIGAVFGIFIAYAPLKKLLKKTEKEKFNTKRIYLYAIPVFFACLFPMLLITLDQILVKHFLSSSEAGFYAAASNIAKIIWFGSGFLVGALFPKVASLNAQKKDTSRLLTKGLTYTALLVILGCVTYFIIPHFIVSVLYGRQYTAIVPLIGIFGIGMGLFSLTQILIAYNLAVEKYKFIYIILAGVVIEILGIILFHKTLLDIVKIFFVSNAAIFAGMLFYNLNDFFKRDDRS